MLTNNRKNCIIELSDEEREIIMQEKFYIHLEEVSPKHFYYGVMGVFDDSPFDYNISTKNGDRENVLNEITKDIIRENKINLNKDVFVFKYDELKDAKTMEHLFKVDDFYKDYRVSALPAIFLSDMTNVNVISNMVKKQTIQQHIIEQSKYGLFK